MNRFERGREPNASPGQSSQPEQDSDLSSLFNYPSLGRLFETLDSPALTEMRARMSVTNQDLERVVRQGSKDEAERAARILRAYQAAFKLLDDLADFQRQAAKTPGT